jgi:hypothetical protein
MKLNRIVVSSDLLRVTDTRATRASFRVNTVFFKCLLEAQIAQATRLPVELLEWEDDGAFDGDKVYESEGLSGDSAGWAQLYDRVPKPETVSLFEPHVAAALVIGFEITPFVQRVLEALDVPFVNVRWHPIRFMDDIFFGFSTNRDAILERLLAHGLRADDVLPHAHLRRAALIRREPPGRTGQPRTLLLGQTPFDSSLIEDGVIQTWTMHEHRLAELAAIAPLVFRPHPFSPEPDPATRALLHRNGIPIDTSGEDIYQLLSRPDIKHVASLSSGALLEARYFGKPTSMLMKDGPHFLPQADPGHDASLFSTSIGIYHAFLSADFWADILLPVLETTWRNDRPLAFKPNRLREVNGSYWGLTSTGGQNFVMPYNTPE